MSGRRNVGKGRGSRDKHSEHRAKPRPKLLWVEFLMFTVGFKVIF